MMGSKINMKKKNPLKHFSSHPPTLKSRGQSKHNSVDRHLLTQKLEIQSPALIPTSVDLKKNNKMKKKIEHNPQHSMPSTRNPTHLRVLMSSSVINIAFRIINESTRICMGLTDGSGKANKRRGNTW